MSSGTSPDAPADADRREARLLCLAFAFLTLAAIALALSPAARSGDWSTIGSRWMHLVTLPVWLGCAWMTHRTLARTHPGRDPILLPTAFMLAGWGLLLVWRLSPGFGARQTLWLVVATAALLAVLRAPGDLRWLRRYRYLWLSGGIALTALTLFFGTNPSGGQERLWLGCCGVYLQPSEPLRLLLIAFLASFLADRVAFGWGEREVPLLAALGPLLLVWGVSVILLLVQRDLGSGLLFLMILAVLLYLASGRWQVLAATGGLAALGTAFGYLWIGVVRTRLLAWLAPWADPTGSGYQIVQSLIASASGGIVGRGPGMGSPGFVPVAHTDFIFASVAEEWGLFGGLGMIALFAVLVSRGLRIAAASRDTFTSLLAAGLSMSLGLQAVLILGGVLRVLPVTGVTLPFVSYGGSSLLTGTIGLGLLLVLSERRGGPSRFRAPLQRLHLGMLSAWGVLALALGWWGLVRGPGLTVRTDNPRRGLAERVVLRGAILDRGGRVLAESVGEQGDYQRRYPEPATAPVVGYDSVRYGQAGIERSLDATLRGEAGHDPLTTWWAHLLTGNPPFGLDVRLTLDLVLQTVATGALGDSRGAVVVIDPRTGDILALASSPSFDPSLLETEWPTLTTRPDAPLLNRATQGRYQPGGALGSFVLAWADQAGLARPTDPATGLLDPLTINGQALACAGLPPAAPGTLASAARSGCPAPLAHLGTLLGANGLEAMLMAFGLDRPPSIDLEVAEQGPLQKPADAAAVRLEAAGQGGLTVTPVQMARAFAALVSGGVLPELRLVDAIQAPDGTWQTRPSGIGTAPVLSQEAARDVLAALDPGGGGFPSVLARAVVGEAAPPLTWYLGASMQAASARVVVVALEDGTNQSARAIGLSCLEAGD